MTDPLDDILDCPFHAAAFTAFVEQARLEQGWPSPIETRERAYRHYENTLAEKHGRPPRY